MERIRAISCWAAAAVAAATACDGSSTAPMDGDAGADDAAEETDATGDADALEDGGTESWTAASISLHVGEDLLLGRALAVFCRCDPPRPPEAEVIAADPPCRLTRSSGAPPFDDWENCTPLNVGEAAVELDGVAYPLVVLDPSRFPCIFTGGRDVPEPARGSAIRFRSTGGSDVPAFDETLTVPLAATLSAPAAGAVLIVGEPWSISWDPAVPNPMVALINGDTAYIACRAGAASSLVASAALTSLWPDVGIEGTVEAWPGSYAVIEGDIPVYVNVGDRGAEPTPVSFAAAP